MLANKLMSALSGAEEKLYVDDVFSAYTYTGNGSTQTINNGIDLAGKGGMVWIKNRTDAYHYNLFDTVRGINKTLLSNLTDAQHTLTDLLTSFDSSGFTLGRDESGWGTNYATGHSNVSWTFRKAPKFFDVVTYTGNGANRTIPHALGQEVGMMLVKSTDATSDWQVYHRSLANTGYLVLNSTAAKATGATLWNSTTPTSAVFSLGTDSSVNASGGTYVAYIFAHDPSADGIVQCGSFTTDGNGSATVNLGWEPQYLMVKTSSVDGDWWLQDTSRGMSNGTSGKLLWANYANPETDSNFSKPNATGFTGTYSNYRTYIYLAIRRPNKPPTTGTEVYNAIARTGTGSATTVTGVGFSPDLLISCSKTPALIGSNGHFIDRLRGITPFLCSNNANGELTGNPPLTAWGMDGVSLTADVAYWSVNFGGLNYIQWFFKRSPGVFDVVCYTGTGSARTVEHSLGVAPELMIVKSRSVSDDWVVQPPDYSKFLQLMSNSPWGSAGTGYWNSTAPTSSGFSIGAVIGTAGVIYVAYLFATKPGISKVGSYTGNGTTQTINCGFTTGARFILIKRTDSTGDWYVWDTARGVVAGNDPHLSLNTTDAEVTTNDSIDPDASGFIVNQVAATNINVSGATYIFLAVS